MVYADGTERRGIRIKDFTVCVIPVQSGATALAIKEVYWLSVTFYHNSSYNNLQLIAFYSRTRIFILQNVCKMYAMHSNFKPINQVSTSSVRRAHCGNNFSFCNYRLYRVPRSSTTSIQIKSTMTYT